MEDAELLYTKDAVEEAFDRLAERISIKLADQNPLVVCVLVGGLYPCGALLSRLNFPLSVDYVHVSRYREGVEGHELEWKAGPTTDLRGRTILLVDDILDEGITLAAVEAYFKKTEAKAVFKAVLVNKKRPRPAGISADFYGLEVPDRYVFGCGMDYKGYWRNLPEIFALASSG